MTSFEKLREYAFLSQAAYRGLSDLPVGVSNSGLQEKLTKTTPDAIGGDNVFSENQAKLLTGGVTSATSGGYTFFNQQANTKSGFSATVFQSNNSDRRVTIAVRGTEPDHLIDSVDLLDADVMGVALSGEAKRQLFDAYRYYKQLTTDLGEVEQWSVDELTEMASLVVGKANPALLSGAFDVRRDVGLGVVSPNAAVDFTGHSLGGHVCVLLADMVARFKGGEAVGDVITYNAPGMGGIEP